MTTTSDGREYDPTFVLTNHPNHVGHNGPDGATITAPDGDLTNGAMYRHLGQGPNGLTPLDRARADSDADNF